MFFKVGMECSHPENAATAAARMMLYFLTVVIMSNVLYPLTMRGSYPTPAFPRHTTRGAVTAEVVVLVCVAAAPACSALPPVFPGPGGPWSSCGLGPDPRTRS